MKTITLPEGEEYAKIKFSHRYAKMPKNTDDTYLLEVFTVEDKKDLDLNFFVYDAKYLVDGILTNYEVPEGKLIVLLLITHSKVWTTIRKWTPEKEKYYKELRSSNVEIVIE